MKKPSEEEELKIYRRFLINLHEAQWTGNVERVKLLHKRLGEYSYARTNSNGDWKQEDEIRIHTLLRLDL